MEHSIKREKMKTFKTSSMALAIFSLLSSGNATYAAEVEKPSIILEHNEIDNNHLSGVIVRGDRAVEIRNSNIHSNGEAGVDIDAAVGMDEIRDDFDQSLLRWINAEINTPESHFKLRVELKDSDIRNNGRAGVNVKNGAEVNISNTKIHHNELSGVMAAADAPGAFGPTTILLSESRVWMNRQGGLRSTPALASMDEPEPSASEALVRISISKTKIHENINAGVLIENATELLIRDSELRENGSGVIARIQPFIPDSPTGNGIHDFEGLKTPDSYKAPKMDIYRNIISFNNGPGVHVVDGTTGAAGIRNNWIFNNVRSGIYLGVVDDSFTDRTLAVSIINNTIASNGSDKNGSGIRDESRGRVLLANNILAFNHETGVRSNECKESTHNLLFANGLAGDCCNEDETDSLRWAERFQRSGVLEGCGDIIIDPLFVNPDKYDFRLKRHSPAIDAGSPETAYNDSNLLILQGTQLNDLGATGGPLAGE